jgi:hypothetical protein
MKSEIPKDFAFFCAYFEVRVGSNYAYHIFIVYLSYIYPIFMVCCNMLEGRESCGGMTENILFYVNVS